jgi:hypothetical protein
MEQLKQRDKTPKTKRKFCPKSVPAGGEHWQDGVVIIEEYCKLLKKRMSRITFIATR